MRVLITGGAGFIGTRLIEELVRTDWSPEIVVLDNLHPQVHGPGARDPQLPAGARFIRADVQDATAWDEVLSEFAPDIVVHLAAETGTGQSLRESSRHTGVNVGGTSAMMDAFARCGAFPERVILTSSRAVYGEGLWATEGGESFYGLPRSPKQLDEQIWAPLGANGESGTPLGHDAAKVQPMPSNVYAATKLAQEHLLGAWCTAFGIDLTVLRLQNVYGAGQALNNPYTGVLTFLARQIVEGRPVEIYEGGGIVRDFVHVSDVVSALVASMAPDFRGSRDPYDIGSGEPGELLEFARILVEASGRDVEIKVTDRYREGDVRAAYAQLERATDQLGYMPKVTFREGARELYAWAAAGPQ